MADTTSKKPFFPVDHHRHAAPLRNPKTLTPESLFWRSFTTSPLASDLHLPVTSLEFSPSPPFDLAAACSASIHLFHGGPSPSPAATLSSFSDVAFSPSFRCDGALLAAGGASGVVQIFRVDRAAPPLRRLRAHSRAVRAVRYPRLADKLHLLSAGDDALVSYWDVTSETPLLSLPAAHRDYARAAAASPASPDLFATASYDRVVKLWDVRAAANSNSVLALDHGDPVESVLFLPSGGLLASAGGNSVKIWDVIGGGRLVHSVESHNKTVTALSLGRTGALDGGKDGGESRLLSVSIDGYLKIFDFAAFKITHSMRYPAQLLSVGFSPSGLLRVVGTSNGIIYMGKKKKREEEEDEGAKAASEFDWSNPKPENPVLRPTNFRYFRRGQNEKPGESDFVIKRPAKVKLAEHDKLLRKFRHKDALVAALNKKNPNSIVAVMEELVARKKLLLCVGNLDRDELGLLLGFLHKFATMPRHARFLMGLAKRVLEMRAEDIQSSDEMRGHVRNLKRVVAEEIQIQQSLREIQGMISPLLMIAGK
uniref:U3 small nucleolar RNA-associated protein 15 C-terminal domain-containing protein n=1 Tax=Puya raimondii TaxID=112807 RepID=A0A8A0WIS7_PUYRA|nr:hypothetical protein PY_020209 [Puya raimondii]